MVIPDYRDFVHLRMVTPQRVIIHSAKGSTWKEHKYIKRKNGTYYYPDDYEGGRHLPDGEEETEDWEDALYDGIEEMLKKNPGLFDPTKISSDDFQDFRLTLAEFAGVDTDKISNEEIERMRQKVKDHYDDAKAARTLSEDDIQKLAMEVIRGNFGSGQTRRDLLGENYQEIQDRVNEILLGTPGKRKASSASEESKKKAADAANKVASVRIPVNTDADKSRVYSVYNKKKEWE